MSLIYSFVCSFVLISLINGLAPPTPTPPTTCTRPSSDVIIAIDGSNAVDSDSFSMTKNFADQVTNAVMLDATTTRVGIYQISSSYNNYQQLTFNKGAVVNAISSMSQLGGSDIQLGSFFFNVRWDFLRPEARKILVIVLSQNPTDYYYTAIKELKGSGVEVFAIGYKNADLTTMQIIGSMQTFTHSLFDATSYGFYTETFSAAVIGQIRKDQGQRCSVVGHGHYSTFDGKKFNFQGVGDFVLVKSTGQFPFTVQTRQILCNTASACNQMYMIQGDTDTIIVDKYQKITLNGVPITESYSYGYGVSLSFFPNRLVRMQFSYGHIVEINFESEIPSITITPSRSLAGQVFGLCGNYDTCPENDLINRQGDQITDVYAFGLSWGVTNDEFLTNDDSTTPYIPDNIADFINTVAAPSTNAVSACASLPEGSWLQQTCLYDVTVTDNTVHSTIQILKYSRECSELCESGRFLESVVDESTCYGCRNAIIPTFDFHVDYNTTKPYWSAYNILVSTSSEFNFHLGGQYNYTLLETNEKASITIYCDNTVTVSAGENMEVKATVHEFPLVRMSGTVEKSANQKLYYSWKFLSFPDDDNDATTTVMAPMMISGESLHPYWVPTAPGLYTLELAVYDGCSITRSTVTVNALCNDCNIRLTASVVPTIFYNDNSDFDSVYSDASLSHNVDSDFEWKVTRNTNDGKILVPTITNGNNDIYYTLTTVQNITNPGRLPTSTVTTTSDVPNSATTVVSPVISSNGYQISYEAIIFTETDTVVSTITEVQTVYPATFTKIIYHCDYWLENYKDVSVGLYTYTYGSPLECIGRLNLEVTSTIANHICKSPVDSIPVNVQCNVKPKAYINCDQQFFRAIGGFSAITLRSRESYDNDDSGYLSYRWRVISSPYYSTLVFNTTFSSANYVFTPSVAGTYGVELTVSDGCSSDSVVKYITAICPTYSPDTLLTVNSTSSVVDGIIAYAGVPVSATYTFSAYNNIGTVRYRSTVIATSGNYSVQQINSHGQNLNFIVPGRGSFVVRTVAYDDCSSVNITNTFTFNCNSVLVPKISYTSNSLGFGNANQFTLTVNSSSSEYINFYARNESTIFNSTNTQFAWYYRMNGTVNRIFAAATETFSFFMLYESSAEITLELSDACSINKYSTTILYNMKCQPPTQMGIIAPTATTFSMNSSSPVDVGFSTYNLTGTVIGYAWRIFTDDPYASGNMPNVASTGPNGIVARFTVPGVYRVELEIQVGCSANRYFVNKTVTILCGVTPYISNYNVNSSSTQVTGKNGKFPIVSMTVADSATTRINETLYDLAWYFLSVPVNSMFKSKSKSTVITRSNATIVSENDFFNVNGTRIIQTITETTVTNVTTTIVTYLQDNANIPHTGTCFYPDVKGTYVIEALFMDVCGRESKKQISVNAVCNSAPAIQITMDNLNVKENRVIIDVATVTDTDGDDLSYEWSVYYASDLPNGSYPNVSNSGGLIEVTNANSLTPSFIPIRGWTAYYAYLRVSDGCNEIFSNITFNVEGLYEIYILSESENNEFTFNNNELSVPNSDYQIGLDNCHVDTITWKLEAFVPDVEQPNDNREKKDNTALILKIVLPVVLGLAAIGGAAAVVGYLVKKKIISLGKSGAVEMSDIGTKS